MPVCIMCENRIDADNYRLVKVDNMQGFVDVVVCNWCAQLVKETFAKEPAN